MIIWTRLPSNTEAVCILPVDMRKGFLEEIIFELSFEKITRILPGEKFSLRASQKEETKSRKNMEFLGLSQY